jgi:hypothetical protein
MVERHARAVYEVGSQEADFLRHRLLNDERGDDQPGWLGEGVKLDAVRARVRLVPEGEGSKRALHLVVATLGPAQLRVRAGKRFCSGGHG